MMTTGSSTQNFAERLALVNGSRRGIGLGIAQESAKEGFNIALNATSKPAAAKEMPSTPSTFTPLTVNIFGV
jgi:NAD(P)-dependent dehydrogenase (short-subunit alcohol dehydrogenase family)